ncbi:hypothetical protein GQX73_g7202 [Xylaria multiplex]|uniref:Uncharacterized protein n=1 Tax=Xylaria multiplex TaxID=323545 RepID=A0A7C8MM56_9PEZI|nr:hypothetical protein GQX73_g7202 [Xylaria multiplex]
MAISPAATVAPQPPDTTMIQISFLYGEHYMHLVEQPKAAAQLFQLLPTALAYGSGVKPEDIVMYSIRPYDTLSTLGYITSQALLYYPNSKVNQLADDVKTPNSALYNQDPGSINNNLTSQINSAIPIWLGSGLAGNPNSGSGGNSDGNDGSSNSDPFGGSGGGNETTAAQKGTTAGIAIGALSVAGAYGAAMFVIARRYKRKKQRHQRSSSISAVDEMRQPGSPALMGGALLSRDFSSSPGYAPGYGATNGGNMRNSQGSGRSGTNHSARTANISAPVGAQNSLGWN